MRRLGVGLISFVVPCALACAALAQSAGIPQPGLYAGTARLGTYKIVNGAIVRVLSGGQVRFCLKIDADGEVDPKASVWAEAGVTVLRVQFPTGDIGRGKLVASGNFSGTAQAITANGVATSKLRVRISGAGRPFSLQFGGPIRHAPLSVRAGSTTGFQGNMPVLEWTALPFPRGAASETAPYTAIRVRACAL